MPGADRLPSFLFGLSAHPLLARRPAERPAAAPPRGVMNSRRFIRLPRRRGWSVPRRTCMVRFLIDYLCYAGQK